MAQIDTGDEKVKKICDLLKNQTLEPAEQEAHKIVEHAKKEATSIVEEARSQANQIIQEAESQAKKKEQLLESSLKLAAKQAVSSLKQTITSELFSTEFYQAVADHLSQQSVIARAVDTVISAYGETGSVDNILVQLPSAVSPEEIVKELSSLVQQKLSREQFIIGSQKSGIIIHEKESQISIDITGKAVHELLLRYMVEHLQHYIFEES